MLNDEKLKAVVEAAGECWHKFIVPLPPNMSTTGQCGCGETRTYNDVRNNVTKNPSPTDLNEITRLVKKILPYYCISIDSGGFTMLQGRKTQTSDWFTIETCGTDAGALLNALYEAVKKETKCKSI